MNFSNRQNRKKWMLKLQSSTMLRKLLPQKKIYSKRNQSKATTIWTKISPWDQSD
jgi:hypothetical protein